MFRKICSILLCFCLPATAFCRQDSLSVAERNALQGFSDSIDRSAEDFVLASVCIADPTNITDDLLGFNGHAWIRLQCPVFHLDNCFSYEGESANENIFRYLTGQTRMGMFRHPTQDYLEDYRHWNRAVHEYKLNLPPDVKQRLWEIMDNHVTNRLSLPHDLTRYGCSLTAVHFVEQALLPRKIAYAQPPDKDLVKTPYGVIVAWSRATVDGHPLMTYAGDLVEAPAPTWWDIWWNWKVFAVTVAIVAALILIVIIIARLIRHRRK